MRRTLCLLALALWLASLACPVMYDYGADQPGYFVLLMSLWGALYLWTLPWVFLNVVFFVLLYRNLKGKPSQELVVLLFVNLALVTFVEILSELVVPRIGAQTAGVFRYGAVLWTIAMALMGAAGFRLSGKNKKAESGRVADSGPSSVYRNRVGKFRMDRHVSAAPAAGC